MSYFNLIKMSETSSSNGTHSSVAFGLFDFHNSSSVNMIFETDQSSVPSREEMLVEVFSLANIWIDIIVISSMLLFGFWCLMIVKSCVYSNTHLSSSRICFSKEHEMSNRLRIKRKVPSCVDEYKNRVLATRTS